MGEKSSYHWEGKRCYKVSLILETTSLALLASVEFLALSLRQNESMFLEVMENIPMIVIQIIGLLIILPLIFIFYITMHKCENVFCPGTNFPKKGQFGLALWFIALIVDEFVGAIGIAPLILVGSALLLISIFDTKRKISLNEVE